MTGPLGRQVRVMRSQTLGRRVPVSQPAWKDGTLPLAWQTTVDPSSVICHVSVPGEPQAKQRPRHTMATVKDGRLRQGHTYTPEATRQAEEAWRWVMIAARTVTEPVPHPVGVLLFFRTTGSRTDADNLTKVVLDAGNGTLWDDDQQVREIHAHVLPRCTTPGTDLLAWSTTRRAPGA